MHIKLDVFLFPWMQELKLFWKKAIGVSPFRLCPTPGSSCGWCSCERCGCEAGVAVSTRGRSSCSAGAAVGLHAGSRWLWAAVVPWRWLSVGWWCVVCWFSVRSGPHCLECRLHAGQGAGSVRFTGVRARPGPWLWCGAAEHAAGSGRLSLGVAAGLGGAAAGGGLWFGKNNGTGCCAGAEVRAGCRGEVRVSGGRAGAVSGCGFGRKPRAPDKLVRRQRWGTWKAGQLRSFVFPSTWLADGAASASLRAALSAGIEFPAVVAM